MEDLINEYGRLAREVGLAGFAVYALVKVWQRMIDMADKQRQDNHDKDKDHKQEIIKMADAHRAELAALERKHVEEMATTNREHRANINELVIRNMDEHRERNRVMVLGWRATAQAFTQNGVDSPNPYPDVDDSGKVDPRKKD